MNKDGAMIHKNSKEAKKFGDGDAHDGIKLSRMDTEGRELSQGQRKYFAHSLVRDKDGNLLVMHHGTNEEFYEFDREKIGAHGAFEGAGFNFTPSKTRASGYSGIGSKNSGRVLSGYVNITNPLSAEEKTLSVNRLAKIIREVDPTGDNIIANYARETRDYGTESFIRRESLVTARAIQNYAENDVDIYSELSASSGGRTEIMESFLAAGYDGLIHYDDAGNIRTVITFSSNQFKLVDNENPTERQDIRFSRADAEPDAPTSVTEANEAQIRYSKIDADWSNVIYADKDKARHDFETGNVVKVYRAMQLIDGELYPPMAAAVEGKRVGGVKKGDIIVTDERPDLAIPRTNSKGETVYYFNLDKSTLSDSGEKQTSVDARYNPYIHTSRSIINDQFSSAWNRGNLVTVEVYVPKSELTSSYKAEKAKDAVGEMAWKSGPVSGALAKVGDPRHVILSRYCKIGDVVDIADVAKEYARKLSGNNITVPYNTVNSSLRDALVKEGVTIAPPQAGNAGDAARPAYEEWKKGGKKFSKADNEIYTEEEYNSYGWIVANEILTDKELAVFMSRVGDRKNGHRFTKTKDGFYAVAVGDEFGINPIIVITNGKYENPSIERAYFINAYDETEIDKIRRVIYAYEKQYTGRRALEIIGRAYEDGPVITCNHSDYQSYSRYAERAKRAGSQADTARDTGLRDGGRADSEAGRAGTIKQSRNDAESMFAETNADLERIGSRAVLKEATVDRWLKEYASQHTLTYSKAYVAYINPDHFVSATTKGALGQYYIRQETKNLDIEHLSDIAGEEAMFLIIEDMEQREPGKYTAKIVGHEGRHRMSALQNAGINKAPVVIIDYSNKLNKKQIPSLVLKNQYSEYGDTAFATNVEPLTYKNRDNLIKIFSPAKMDELSYKYSGKKMVQYSRNDATDDFFAELAEREETEKRQALAAENEKLRGTVKDLMDELIRTREVHYTEQSITKPLKEILARYSVDKKALGNG